VDVEDAEHAGAGDPVDHLADPVELIGLDATVDGEGVPGDGQAHGLEPDTGQALDVFLGDEGVAPADLPRGRVVEGVANVDVYNANIGYRFGNENFTQDFYDHRWHGAGTSNTYPSTSVGSNDNSKPNTFFVESGAYFRVRNAQLGYTLPGNSLKKYGVQKIRFYANAQNAINIFGYKGFTPEIGGSVGNMGIDSEVYPLFATYNFGVNVTF